jgi:hypothetical protein
MVEILKEAIPSDEFRFLRAIFYPKNVINRAGSIIKIPRTPEGRNIFVTLGGLCALDPVNIPPLAPYVAIVRIERKDKDKRKIVHEPDDIIELDRGEAIRLMSSAGRVRPTDETVCDLSYFLPFRYAKPLSYPTDRALPLAEQRKARLAAEREALEKERAAYAEIDRLKKKKKPNFSTGWRP